MVSHNPIMGLMHYLPFVGWIIFWIISRGASESRPSPPAPDPRFDTWRIATSVSGWHTSSRPRRHESPVPTPSPRSHPLWDRELDG
jgi:hypothetical protein